MVRKSERNQKKLDEDAAMLGNTLWSDRRRLITKTFVAFLRTFKRLNWSQLSKKALRRKKKISLANI